MLAFRQLHHEFFDESGDVSVADHRAFIFLDTENLRIDMYFKVLTHFHLTAEPPIVKLLTITEKAFFRW